MEAVILFSILIITIALSIPIGITLGLSTALAMYFTSDIPLLMLAQKSVTGLDSFPLLAIPFFILAGALMCGGGISRRLVNLAEALVGFITGGLAMVTVLACMFFAAISGSGPATVSAIGSFMIPSMKERKYDAGFAAAITAAAGTIGVIIPPSIPFVIYCVVAQCSIGDMFIAGIVPGIIIGIALMVVCYGTAKKRHYLSVSERPRFSTVWKAFKDAFWALLVPVIILGGIFSGVFTITEASAVAVLYSGFLAFCVNRSVRLKDIPDMFLDAASTTGLVLLLAGAGSVMAWAIANERLLDSLIGPLSTMPWWLFLLCVNILLLIVGCFMDDYASIVILAPLIAPIAWELGIDPLHIGLVICINLVVGLATPPFGITLFVTSPVAGVRIEDTVKEAIPFIAATICVLLLVTFCPKLVLFLPRLAGY